MRMRVSLGLIPVVAFALVFGQDAGAPPVVTIEHGQVKGASGQSRDGRMYYSFQGIPYGKIAERFQAPVAADNWEGVKDTAEPGPHCIQYSPFKKEVIGQEECLNLNVFTPRLPMQGKDTVLLPVVVYLHPGLNTIGSNVDYDPKYFMDEDVILVVPNFRLGLFGFLNTGDKYAPGNAGLKDQVQALKWIQNNIEKFGGDKSRVTLLGSGSGGADAFLHTLSPQSKGLLHNVITMGGSTLSRTSFILNPVKQAKKLATQVDCPTDSSQALVMCLQNKDAKEILDKAIKLEPEKLNLVEKAWFGPTVDKLIEGQTEEDLIIPDNPVKLLKEGKVVNKVPLIIGGNTKEGVTPVTAALLKKPELFEKLDKKWSEVAPTLFIYKDTAADKEVVTKKIRDFYFGDKAINRETFINVTNIFMDRFMGFGVLITAKYYSNVAPVYLYVFSHKPETTGLKYFGVENENFGMAHLDDIQYLFKSNNERFPFPEINKDHKEYQLSHNLVKLLSSFAETGKPSKTYGDAKEWPQIPAMEISKAVYIIGENTKLKTEFPGDLHDRFKFWLDLYTQDLAKEKETPQVEPF